MMILKSKKNWIFLLADQITVIGNGKKHEYFQMFGLKFYPLEVQVGDFLM